MAGIDQALTDEELSTEIELVCALVIAAAEHNGPLTEAEIDRALGIDRGALRAHVRAS